MPRHTEPSANTVLGNLLQPMLGKAVVRSENVRAIVGQPGLQPDILITAEGRAPVVVEAEYLPAYTAEAEARSRLGLAVVESNHRIEAVVALRYPEAVGDADDLNRAVQDARFSYCVFTVEKYSQTPERSIKSIARFPESGWLEGCVADLADLIRLVSVPQLAVEAAADALQGGIDRAALSLEELESSRPNINGEIASLLGMDNVPQTRRMAGAIIANAMVFQERIAGIHAGIKSLSQVCGPGVSNPKAETLAAWTAILGINYWPIFDVARRILNPLPSDAAAAVLRNLQYTAEEVGATGVDNSQHLTGRVFQRLISDRKYLATFYTLPTSAALLARLAVAKMEHMNWADTEALGKLRIGDFACGTGALLSAVYEQIVARHEQAGGNAAQIHPVMMEEVLYGCDVMPSAVHITSSTLAGAQPTVGFSQSRLYTIPYGRLSDGNVAIGSLEYLNSNVQMTLSNFSDPVLRTNGNGDENVYQVVAVIPDEEFDLVIMNPPFTSNTKHFDADDGVLNAAFAAFDSSDTDQSRMGNRLKQLARNTSYHGHAGLGSAFAFLASKKVRPTGVVALVLPFTAINGASWAKFRELIATQFTDVTIVSIAANGRDMSFSSDTGMAECLVIGRKIAPGENPSGRGTFISLRNRPASFVVASELVKSILIDAEVWQLEDGPYGGIPIACGDTQMGEVIEGPVGSYESGWSVARILDVAVAQTAHLLSTGKLWLPAEPEAVELPIVQLNQVGQLGVHDSMLTMTTHKGPFTRGPFSLTATYPSLWNHNAKSETKMVCEPDSQLRVRRGMTGRASELWETATRTHLNRDFTFGSQALAVAFTERESIGGRVWPNVGFSDKRFDYAFAVWGNSTLGLLAYWWHSSRQQSSKASMTRLAIPLLPVLDFRALTDEQLAKAGEIFEEFRDKELQPAYLADADPNRALLDKRVVCDLLGFEDSVYQAVRQLAAKWCNEPSVHGGKQRPRDATLAV